MLICEIGVFFRLKIALKFHAGNWWQTCTKKSKKVKEIGQYFYVYG